MKEILFFIFDNMTDYEITFAMHMLNTSEIYKVVTIAYSEALIVARSGAIYKPERLVSHRDNSNAEGLIICGGWYGDYKGEIDDLIHELDHHGKLVAGICGAGTFFLAKAGLLVDRKYTTPITEWREEHQKIFGEVDVFDRTHYENKVVVKDRNVITSLGHGFMDFTAEILDWYTMFENQNDKIAFVNDMKNKV